ncbi:hypothetical protein [Herbaspirillum huttiense]|uniref:hypothetical protein n=1 Tax=Herbaspirillum huttiense TaxID=863372 RepID=UPI0039AF802E
MARFSMAKEFEVKESVDSPTIARLRSIADDGKVGAHSLKHRHPRFANRFTQPHYYAWFKMNGTQYAEDAETLNDLNMILERDYLCSG